MLLLIFLITGPGNCVLNVALLGLSAVEAREWHSFLKLRVVVRYYGKRGKTILEEVLFASLAASHGTKKTISYCSRGGKKILFFPFWQCACVCVQIYVWNWGLCFLTPPKPRGTDFRRPWDCISEFTLENGGTVLIYKPLS